MRNDEMLCAQFNSYSKKLSPKAWIASKKIDRSNYITLKIDNILELFDRREANADGI